ncbi:choice-of-anchor G family protein [Clavibacter sepedonicus]|uniref:Exported protein n=1 Tax=Clavibacter sepedonicus TaxID=31964 RepID=B0RCC4_CLASE|nr:MULTISPECIES: choice-of-anchor G family protein [Clavibacter]MBD5380552.1 choice-of-anchor G family protein [Clavibacter sp.]OQJ53999.1 hypothetical protein B5P20_07635 [Clavibacter sepedonicus]UUK65530.1 choice-of-anchor G family protein [Clavibacter sepedonicus]CAQ03012.1 putative exported protein [Clavibacter sepedonicus]
MSARHGLGRHTGRRAEPAQPRRSRDPRLPRRAALVAAAVAVALVAGSVTPGLVPVAAAWTDREWTHERVATETVDCGVDTGYTTRASSRFLDGNLLTLDLDTVAGVQGLTAIDDQAAGAQVTPASARVLGPGVFANPLAVTAVAGAAALDLSGLSLGLPAGSAGALNQYARVSETGVATGASGLVSDSGGVGVTSGTPPASLPGRATISLGRVLPAVTDVTDASLAVGAVASRSTLDWCAARESDVWGDGSVSGVTRDYGIAGLDLRVASPAVSGLTSAVNTTTATALPAAATSLSGTTGLVGQLITARIGALVKTLGLGALTGTITVTGVDAAATAVAPLLTHPLRSADGTVVVDLVTGTVRVDLAALLGSGPGGLNGLGPNSEIVVDAALLNAVSARVGALVDARSAEIRAAMTTALQGVRIVIDVSTVISATVSVAGLGLTTAEILRLAVQFDGTLAQLAAGTVPIAVTPTVLPTSGLVGAAVNALLGTLLGVNSPLALGALLDGSLTTGLVAPIVSTVTNALTAPVTTLGATLAGLSARLVTAVAAVVNPLPSVVSLMVNVQPDQPGAPPGATALPAVPPDTSAEYEVTALRIGLVDALAPASGFAVLELATSTAGRSTFRTP